MMKLARLPWFLLMLTAGRLAAQMAGPAPLTGATSVAGNAPGGWIVAIGRADAALQLGFPATAAGIYREILREPALPAETRAQATLGLVTAQLDAGETADAEKILQAFPGPRDTAYQLRVGLIAAIAHRKEQARAALAAGKVEELPPADRGWWYFLQALVADMDNDFGRRETAFAQANSAAASELQRARISLAQEQALLRNVPLDDMRVTNLRQTMEKYPGQRTGYDAARSYAAALALLGRNAEALAVLQRQLAILPATERNVGDQMRLTLGLVAGEGSLAGRQAFKQLMRDGQKPETQRLALQLLDRGAKTPLDRDQLRRDLGELIGAPVQNPIIEDMLLVRAQTALVDKGFAQAEEDARALLDRYPNSPLRTAALGVRLAVAWEGKRYRTAADVIAQLRTILPPGRERAELGVLLAEAFFLAEDYKNAADAYAAALQETPSVVPAGQLIFQHVLADIRADQLGSAAKQLDEAAANPAFDAVSRWQAEWNLVKEMQVRGPAQAAAAYERVNRLLTGGAQGVPEDLRIRLMWLRAKLSFDNDKLEEAQQQAEELLKLLQQGGQFEPTLRTNVTSMALLLKAQALLALKRDADGFALFEQLRKDYQATDAAQYSYLVHAGYLTQRGDIAGAQAVLNSFVDNPAYKRSDYAPLALYEAALNEERLGLERNLRDAYKKLERLIQDYPRDELVFYARLKQGDLLRKLNDFAAARQIYEDLVNNPVPHPDVLLAQLALANCLYALSTNSPVNYEGALAIFERLRDLPTAPLDLRAEAGFDWGYALAKRERVAKAQEVFWAVANDFLLDAGPAAKLGAKGRWWVSKSLLELAKIHEEAGRLDEAQRVYQLILDQKLSGQALAQDKLVRFRGTGGAKP